MIAVPLVHGANQGRALALGYLAFTALYLAAAAVHARAPVTLSPGVIDAATPYLDWSVWVYLTQFLLLPVAIVLARDDSDRSRAYYAMLAATVIAAAVFVAWPTRLERLAVPATGLAGLAWAALYASDTQYNCFPSLHAALAAIAGGALWRAGRCATALAWPALVVASTLTTKQHVFVDAAGGLALAALAWTLTPRLFRYERPKPVDDAARI